MTDRPGRRGSYFFNSKAGAEYLGMSPRTFRRYIRLLGIQPRRMYRRPGKWFTFEDIQRIAEIFGSSGRLSSRSSIGSSSRTLSPEVQVRRMDR